MFSDQDILEENHIVLTRRHRLLHERSSVDPLTLGMSPESAAELKALTVVQAERAADAASPLFNFALDDQILRLLEQADTSRLVRHPQLDSDCQEDSLLLLTNRWTSSRHSPSFAGTVLGLSRRLINALALATYTDIRRVASSGIRPRLVVKPQYIFHAGRNIMMHRGQRTHLALANSRYNSF